jgi:gamma-glutamyl phosphate reductase
MEELGTKTTCFQKMELLMKFITIYMMKHANLLATKDEAKAKEFLTNVHLILHDEEESK